MLSLRGRPRRISAVFLVAAWFSYSRGRATDAHRSLVATPAWEGGGGLETNAEAWVRSTRTHYSMVVRQALTLSLIALHCAAAYKTGKVVSCNA